MNYSNRNYFVFLIYLISFWLLFNVFWVSQKFDNPTLDQVIFHLQFGIEEADFDKSLVTSYLIRCCFYPLLITTIVLAAKKRIYGLRNALIRDFLKKTIHLIPFFLIVFSVGVAIYRFNVIGYFRQTPSEDVIAKYYINPDQLTLNPTKQKNLILIYVESLEKSYSDTNVFNVNLVEALDNQLGAEIESYIQMPGAGWTMGGIVSSQCAIPLKSLGLGDGNHQGKLYKSFLPNATCLGDELYRLGYINVFLGGASLKFSGKGKFFRGHGYEKVMGRDEWLATGRYAEKDFNGWGLFDKDIFAEARAELNQLHSLRKPFNLTVLTVDTHFANGYMSDKCKASMGKGKENIELVIQCTASEVSEFIDYVRAKGYLEDTNIVILGDHLFMGGPLTQKLKKIPSRRIYNKWIGSTPAKFNRTKISHFDIAPTILEYIGVTVPGARYGLGYSALAKDMGIPDEGYYDELLLKLNNKSAFYSQFWIKQ